MKAAEMRERSLEELEHLLTEWREELFRLNIQSMTGQREKSNRTREIQKRVARALTILREKRSGGVERESKAS